MGSKSTRKKVTKPGPNEGDNEFLKSGGHLLNYVSSKFKSQTEQQQEPPPPPLSASGGDVYNPGNGYRYHKFSEPNSDNFVVSSLSPSAPLNKIDILIVAGGGSNATPAPYTGGAGAGGVVHATNVTLPSAKTYPIGVGAGGATGSGTRNNGADSTFGGHPTGTITAKGGGYGGFYPADNDANPGGSGGGRQESTSTTGTGTQPSQNTAWTPDPNFYQYGNPGGSGGTTGAYQAPGGGGAGETGGSAPSSKSSDQPGGYGGRGQPIPGFEYPLIGLGVTASLANSPSNNHYGGGGMGWGYAAHPEPGRMRAYGGGGSNNIGSGASPPYGPQDGVDGLGGGAGASGGGRGGDGIVVIRYQTS